MKIESTNPGSLCDWQIQELINKKKVFDGPTLKYISVGPASFDVASTNTIYRIENTILPNPDQKISELLKDMGATVHDIKNPLEKEVQYICKVGTINLPVAVYGYGNAKSSTGRIDLHVRIFTDYRSSFDTITSGKKEIWLHITPHSFSVKIPDNTPLLQVRLFNGDTRMNYSDILEFEEKNKFISYAKNDRYKFGWKYLNTESKKSILFTLNAKNNLVGYKAKKTNKILDMGRLDHDKKDFFEEIYKTNNKIHLDKDAFYILSTREYLNIPENIAGEMIANDIRLGEFRTHYAGFFDPGFAGEGVLEVRPQENITFFHGQPIVTMQFEKMSAVPKRSYKVGHNYFGQRGPRLAKFFRK